MVVWNGIKEIFILVCARIDDFFNACFMNTKLVFFFQAEAGIALSPSASLFVDPKKQKLLRQTAEELFAQSGCRDLNPGPLAPQTSTLTGLSYIPCF